jgi:bacteriorhodopsin
MVARWQIIGNYLKRREIFTFPLERYLVLPSMMKRSYLINEASNTSYLKVKAKDQLQTKSVDSNFYSRYITW